MIQLGHGGLSCPCPGPVQKDFAIVDITFNILDMFHLLTLQGKVSAYKFYSTLQHKTDNTGISDTKVRF